MKRLLLVLTLPMAILFSQAATPSFHQKAKSEADLAWPGFLADLRAAVKKRDQAALEKLMPKKFEYDCCDNYDENKNGRTTDEAFRRWQKFPKAGWVTLGNLLSQRAVPATAQWTTNNHRSKPNLMLPTNANSKSYKGPIADFEWRDGRWWFASFQYPEAD
jgi:hypothetical protein